MKMRSEYRQVVKLSSPGELRAYVVHEHELEQLSQGSSISYLLSGALFCFGVSATAFGTVFTVAADATKTFLTFLVFACVSLALGIVLSLMWFFLSKSTTNLVKTIRSRLPENEPVKQLEVEEMEIEEVESSEEQEEETG